LVNNFVHFPIHNIRFAAKTSAPMELEWTQNFGLETLTYWIYLVFVYAISALEEHGNKYKPVCTYALRAYKQTLTYTKQGNRLCFRTFPMTKLLPSEPWHLVRVWADRTIGSRVVSFQQTEGGSCLDPIESIELVSQC
jgi:hypothetical protein